MSQYMPATLYYVNTCLQPYMSIHASSWGGVLFRASGPLIV